jgi:HK97 gp10 family phage protein
MPANTGNIQITIDTRKLDMILNGLSGRAEGLLDKVARDVEHDAKQLAPFDTGALSNSIHVEPDHKPFERVIADAVAYGVYQEFGTSHMAAHPFMIPAIEHNRKSFLEAWEQLF